MPPQMQARFLSPAMQNLNLPLNPAAMNGSPHLQGGMQHTPSPAQVHMQAPGMVAQRSQQGNTVNGASAAASANTSPNATNKRRRASAVKVEGDEGGGVQPKVKQSPRVGGNKRIKGQG